MKKAIFGIIVTTRGFFNPLLAGKARAELLKMLEELGYGYVILGEEDTRYGAVETLEDAKKCAQLFSINRDKITGIIVCIPNFGDEVGVVNAIKMPKLDVPVLVQACDDAVDKMDLENRRDSFCGKLSICNNLYQYNIKFTNTTLHTCAINNEEFKKDVEYFARVCNVVQGIGNARIAQIGTRPAPFQTVRYSEKLLQASGITVVPVDLSEIIAAANRVKDDEEVANTVKYIKEYGRVPDYINAESIRKSAKLYLAVKRWMEANGCTAGTMQCWPSIQENYGCAACLIMSMLGENGTPMACETDVAGAVSMYALYLASGVPAGFVDWNNSYCNERDKCIVIHCSNYPKSFFGCDFEISNLDILGKSLGYDKCFGACKAQLAPGDMTFARISTDDVKGRIKVYVGEGEFTDDHIATAGGPGVCRINNLQGFMDYLCRNGFEHHVAMNRTNSSRVLEEALGNYLGWNVYNHS